MWSLVERVSAISTVDRDRIGAACGCSFRLSAANLEWRWYSANTPLVPFSDVVLRISSRDGDTRGGLKLSVGQGSNIPTEGSLGMHHVRSSEWTVEDFRDAEFGAGRLWAYQGTKARVEWLFLQGARLHSICLEWS